MQEWIYFNCHCIEGILKGSQGNCATPGEGVDHDIARFNSVDLNSFIKNDG